MQKRKTVEGDKELTLEQRRRFLKLPIAKRRAQMVKQAARMVRLYQSDKEGRRGEQWQGGDIVEPS